MYGLIDGVIEPQRKHIAKLIRAINLILALDGQPEVYPPRDISLKTWVVRLDPKVREQLEDALQEP